MRMLIRLWLLVILTLRSLQGSPVKDVTEDDVKGMLKAQNLRDIMPGDCVALHTGQGNTWSNDRFKTMTSEQRAAARAIFAKGEPGFGASASNSWYSVGVRRNASPSRVASRRPRSISSAP